MEESIQETGDLANLSRNKLQAVAKNLFEWVPKDSLRQLPCELHTMYRCRCSFQCVWIEGRMKYAVRQNKEPFLIDDFPVANRRIQCAMLKLLNYINDEQAPVFLLRRNLTSVAFSSAWNDREDAECCLTLFYDEPVADDVMWKAEATRLCAVLSMTQITGRSRKSILFAIDSNGSMIRDIVWLTYQRNKWNVSLASPTREHSHDTACLTKVVYYEKPEGAFCHPNAYAMCDALEWLINQIDWINQNVDASKVGKCRLLELYCGCGAHTMAILQTNILGSVVALELDQRLVDACRKNYDLNCLMSSKLDSTITPLEIVSADAGLWSKARGKGVGSSDTNSSFDILLVDPPRQGLDEHVCRLANTGTFQHFLYISCGHDALVRDLARLSGSFEVVDCVLLDLFPQLNAVETLVHLRRRVT
jgi:tRNA (uracil-5-)-methyltransferase